MRLVSWNVDGRVAEGATRQISAVLERAADIVTLHEVTLASYPSWCDALMDEGHVCGYLLDKRRPHTGGAPEKVGGSAG